jgi:hypothetical protein
LNTAQTVASLTITAGSTLTIGAGVTLTIAPENLNAAADCEEADPCSSDICQNGATCDYDGVVEGEHYCNCTGTGHTGAFCEILDVVDASSSSSSMAGTSSMTGTSSSDEIVNSDSSSGSTGMDTSGMVGVSSSSVNATSTNGTLDITDKFNVLTWEFEGSGNVTTELHTLLTQQVADLMEVNVDDLEIVLIDDGEGGWEMSIVYANEEGTLTNVDGAALVADMQEVVENNGMMVTSVRYVDYEDDAETVDDGSQDDDGSLVVIFALVSVFLALIIAGLVAKRTMNKSKRKVFSVPA